MFEISASLSLLSGFLWGIIFVGSLYFWSIFSPIYLNRDDPQTIKSRFLSVFVVCITCTLYISLFWKDSTNDSFWNEIGLGGSIYSWVVSSLACLILNCLLFAGPLFFMYLEPEFAIPEYKISDLRWWRTFVVGPIGEEWVFRGSICPLMIAGGWSFYQTTFLSPLCFGLAHFHHFFQHLGTSNQKRALFETLFQLFYTTVFGSYSAFLFLRTKILIGPILVHSFCNYLGFPKLDSMLDHPSRNLILVFLFGGFFLFCFLLFPLTEPTLFH